MSGWVKESWWYKGRWRMDTKIFDVFGMFQDRTPFHCDFSTTNLPSSRKKQNIPKPNSHYWVHDFLAYPVWWDMNFLVSLEGMTLQSPRRITGADRRMPWHGDSPGWSHWDWSHEKCAVPWENRRFWGNVCIAWVGRCFSRRGLLRVLKTAFC